MSTAWSFELSLLVFLSTVAVSQALGIGTKSRVSLPFVLGTLCIAGFALGLFPPDFVVKSRMRDVGFIAFNVLIVHNGILLDFRKLARHRNSILVGLSGLVMAALFLGIGLAPVVGREAALFSMGPVMGGGAASAIASNSAFRLFPGLAVLPWLLFMMQGFFGLPLFAFSIRKEISRLSAHGREASAGKPAAVPDDLQPTGTELRALPSPIPLCDRLPVRYRTNAYYLAALMGVALLNRWLYGVVFSKMGVHPALTGLLLGALLARLGLLERNALVKSGAMDFLMLGLMALMADSFSGVPFGNILTLSGSAALIMSLGCLVAVLAGALLEFMLTGHWYRGIALVTACMISIPPSRLVASGIIRAASRDEDERQSLESEILPSLDAVSTVIAGVAAVAVSSLVSIFM